MGRVQPAYRCRSILFKKHGSHSGAFFEQIDKVVCVLNSHCVADLVYPHIGGKQQIFGGFHAAGIQVAKRRHSVIMGEFPAKPFLSDGKPDLKLLQMKRNVIGLVEGLFHFPDVVRDKLCGTVVRQDQAAEFGKYADNPFRGTDRCRNGADRNDLQKLTDGVLDIRRKRQGKQGGACAFRRS